MEPREDLDAYDRRVALAVRPIVEDGRSPEELGRLLIGCRSYRAPDRGQERLQEIDPCHAAVGEILDRLVALKAAETLIWAQERPELWDASACLEIGDAIVRVGRPWLPSLRLLHEARKDSFSRRLTEAIEAGRARFF